MAVNDCNRGCYANFAPTVLSTKMVATSSSRQLARLVHMVVFREAPVDNGRVSPHKHRITEYLRPKTLAMLLLGFSSGLPFLLVGNTFGFWLRDEHTSLTAIGFLSWVGIAYSLKFLWAPVMD
ncbi:MAG: hypothetical protein WCE73_03830, partial [Candidatus Angelobacter sp.]